MKQKFNNLIFSVVSNCTSVYAVEKQNVKQISKSRIKDSNDKEQRFETDDNYYLILMQQ